MIGNGLSCYKRTVKINPGQCRSIGSVRFLDLHEDAISVNIC